MVMRLGSYLLVERLNQGGMADVYLAKTFGFGGADQTVAVKCIRPEIAEDPTFVRMFIDEAKLAVLLDHANIAQTHELGRIGTTYFISMEYVLGRDLRAVIDRARARGLEVPEHLVLHIIGQVCEGLDYAHRKTDPTGVALNIVHRDVSPQNVLVGYSGEVKLIDFGIAKAASHASRSQAGVLKGKYGYMSPEQVRGEPVDHRSDVFAAGILFWELLTRQRLFPGSSDFSVLEKVRYAEIFPPTLVVPKTDSGVEEIVMRALARDAGQRYGSASDLREDIVKVLLERYGQPTARQLANLMQTLFEQEKQDDMERLDQARRYTEIPEEVPELTCDQVLSDAAGEPGTDPDGGPDGRTTVDPDGKDVEQTAADPREVARPSGSTRDAGARPTVRSGPARGSARPTVPQPPGSRRPASRAAAPSDPEAVGEHKEATPTDKVRIRAGSPTSGGAVSVSQADPTEIHAVPRRFHARDLVIIMVALVVAAGLVVSTYFWTQRTGDPAHGGLIVVTDPPGAQIVIDGARAGETPFSSSALDVGPHTVVLQSPGRALVTREVHVVADRVVELRLKLPRPEP